MFHVYRKEIDWGGKTLVLETGKIARQADGAVLATMGETSVLCTAVAAKSARDCCKATAKTTTATLAEAIMLATGNPSVINAVITVAIRMP